MRIMEPEKKLRKLESLLSRVGLQMAWKYQDKALHIGSQEFRAPASPQDFESLPQKSGLILKSSSRELRKSLQERQISYLDLRGFLHIHLTSKEKLIIEETPKLKQRSKKPSTRSTNISTTLLVSPNAFALIDALFTVDLKNIKAPSTYQFCQQYQLNQPKVSKVMRALGVKNLIDLREALQKIPIEWWLFAFDSPATKRKMNPFFESAQDYYSLDPQIEALDEKILMQTIRDTYDKQVMEGPLEWAKYYGELMDSRQSFWVTPAALSDFKKRFRLVAGRKEGMKPWMLASPRVEGTKAGMLRSSIMRAIWDLSFGEARLREIRSNLLRKFFGIPRK